MDKTVNDIYKNYMKMLTPYIGINTTYSGELDKKGKRIFGKRFKGVFPADRLPTLKNREMYIANLDNHNEKGSHWVAVYHSNGKNYVYDSFGRKSKKIFKSIYGKGRVKDTQYDAEQKVHENSCGLRSMVALYMFDNHDPEIISKYL